MILDGGYKKSNVKGGVHGQGIIGGESRNIVRSGALAPKTT
jgi:hypothetical protein